MKKLNKTLISILLISILMIVVLDVTTASKPINNEQIQDQRLTNLEDNDTVQLQNNTQQEQKITDIFSQINNILDQISSLIGRVTYLENNPTYSATYGSFVEYKVYPDGINGEIKNITINLPIDAYVYAIATGKTGYDNPYGTGNPAGYLAIRIDNQTMPDWAIYSGPGQFSVSAIGKLNAGEHKIYLLGSYEPYNTVEGMAMAVIINQIGSCLGC